MLQVIKKFTEPVIEEEVPNLAQHIDKSMIAVSVVSMFVSIPSFTMLFLWLELPTSLVLGEMAFIWLLFAGCLLIKNRLAVRWLHWGVFSSWILMFASLALFTQTRDLVDIMFCIPLSSAMIVPRSPTFSGALCMVLIVVMSLVQFFILDIGWVGVIWTVSIGSTLMFFCCTSVQAVRRLMQDLHVTSHRLIATERIDALGQQTAGIAHNLKTPIASSMSESHCLKDLMEELGQSVGHPEITDHDLLEIHGEMHQHLILLDNGLERIAEFVGGLRKRTLESNDIEVTTFAIQERVQAVLLLLLHQRDLPLITIKTDNIPEGLIMSGDVAKFEQVLNNLISNAIDACVDSGQRGLVEISARQAGSRVVVIVEDNGPGIPEEHQNKIFEPLFTTRSQAENVGLGLSVCRDIIQGYFEGSLSLMPSKRGARFELRIPIHNTHEDMKGLRDFVPFPVSQEGSLAVFQDDEIMDEFMIARLYH